MPSKIINANTCHVIDNNLQHHTDYVSSNKIQTHDICSDKPALQKHLPVIDTTALK